MGVLTDYFRAPTRAAVEQAMRDTDGGPLNRLFDCAELKGVDDAVILGKLIGLIRGVEWSPELSGSTVVHPPPDSEPTDPQSWDALPEDSPWVTGPWVTELSLQARDTLASAQGMDLAAIATSWAAIEEFSGDMHADTAAEMAAELIALAKRAAEYGDLLYCWVSL